MRKLLIAATVALLGVYGMVCMADAQDANVEKKTVTKEINQWCTVITPESAKIGDKVEVKIVLKGVKAPTKLSCHLHFEKEGKKYGGLWCYAKPVDVVAADGAFTFKYTLTEKEGAVMAIPVIFLSPDGDWKNKTANCSATAFNVSRLGKDITNKADAKPGKTAGMEFKKSWIHVDPGADRILYEGDEWPIKIEYYLDPSEDTGSTRISFVAVGPWIDNPDEKYQKVRHHETYPGLGFTVSAQPGRNVLDKKLVMPKAFQYNSLLCITTFKNDEIGNWPWELRCNGPMFRVREKLYEVSTDKPGNLFTYAEPVKINLVARAGAVGKDNKIQWKAYDVKSNVAASGNLDFKADKEGQNIPVEVKTDVRGVLFFEAEAEGWGKRGLYFARIPDVLAITGGKETQFGMAIASMQNQTEADEVSKTGVMLGLTMCRFTLSLKNYNPAKGELRIENIGKTLDTFKRNGLRTWIMLEAIPAWMQLGKACNQGFAPVPFDEDGWRETIKVLAEKWKGKAVGWEWLNEIVPGDKCKDPAADYVRFCRIGTETVKAVDPNFQILMAGGLWPRNFRNAVLAAGCGKYVDVLPVHYGNGQGILEARADLDVAGAGKTIVWDNETARGLSTWGVPPLEAMKPDIQSNWVLNNWPDELVGGAQKIIYFGGAGDPCGNWSYMMGNMNPRPVAATIAVFASKIYDAKPVGKFFVGDKGVFHLFEKNGKAILLASLYGEGGNKTYDEDKETMLIPLTVGSAEVTVTDYQGNETKLKSANGVAGLNLARRRVFVEGADLDVLKGYLVPSVEVAAGQMPRQFASVTFLKNSNTNMNVQIKNICSVPVSGSINMAAPEGWPAQKPLTFNLKPGENSSLQFPVALSQEVKDGVNPAKIIFKFENGKFPVVEKTVNINIISQEMLGNLVKNSGFENDPPMESWGGEATRADSAGLGIGIGKYVAKFAGSGKWQSLNQDVPVAPGQTYLYSAWIWNSDMDAGSNVSIHKTDNTTKMLYINNTFNAGKKSNGWKYYSCHLDGGDLVKKFSLIPVTNGKGTTYFDNVRLTTYEGSDYVAEAHKTKSPIVVDGKLDEWQKKCPIPLIGDNQLIKIVDSYAWSPTNLSAAAYISWDEKNLYVGVEVKDDVMKADITGDKTVDGDSVVLAFLPSRAAPDSAAFCYYVSNASPGGGSGKFTLFRPSNRSGALNSGHLTKDSSVYEIAVRRENDTTTYELRMPVTDMGGIVPAIGTKAGMSILVNDNDGTGRVAAMKWGEGLYPSWTPKRFGILTLVE